VADLRVLQVLADTDDTDDARFALDLHGALAARSLSVRTVALGPGRRGGLESLVPTMSPSRRSIAAHTQLRREQRWADVVVLRGGRSAEVAGLARIGGGPPHVLALAEDVRRWESRGVPSRVRRLLERGPDVVVTDETAATGLMAVAGVPAERVAVVPYGVDVAPPPTSAAQRSAAREALGLPVTGVVARFVGRPGGDDGAATATRAAARAGVPWLDGTGADDELVVAAADVAVLPTRRTAGPPRGLLLAGRSGAALLAPASVGLVDAATGRPAGPDEDGVTGALRELRAASPEVVAALGAGASAAVRAGHDLVAVAASWADLLRTAAGRTAS
jgi:hypothetical protein